MNRELLDQIRQIAADAFNEALPKVVATSSPDSIEGWDSLTHVNFVMAIEQTFGFELDPDDVEEARLGIAQTTELVAKKLGR